VPAWSSLGQLSLLDVGLLRACRQIHIETTGLFYSLNVFRLNNNMDLLTLTACLNEEKRSVIRRLDLRLRAAESIEKVVWRSVVWRSVVWSGCDCSKLLLFPSLEAVHVWGDAKETRKNSINKCLAVATGKRDLRVVWVAAQDGASDMSSG
jgi:hypothetical protein